MTSTTPATTPKKPRRWLKRIGFSFLWLITLIVLAYVVENWRGRRAWQQYVADAEARGERLDPESVIPPMIPDAENMAMAPIFKPLFDYLPVKPGEPPRLKDPAAADKLRSMNVMPNLTESTRGVLGNWRDGKDLDVAGLATRYRKDSQFPQAPESASAAEVIATALSKYDREYDGFSEACARPKSRFPLRYLDGAAMSASHYNALRSFAIMGIARARNELAAGKVDAAFADEGRALRAAESLEDEPVLISLLVRISLIEPLVIPLWTGMVKHQWTDDELAHFESRLARINLARDEKQAIRGERNLFGFPTLDMIRNSPGKAALINPDEATSRSRQDAIAFRMIPSGWIDQNKVQLGRMYDGILQAVDANAVLFLPDPSLNAPMPRSSPYNMLSRLAAPAASRITVRCAFTQDTVSLARIAIAAERHRLKHGSYPADLESLDPAVKPTGGELPKDPVAGTPVHYRVMPSGGIRLYFNGWNQKDDGGLVIWNDKQHMRVNEWNGDWVWPELVGE